MVPHALPSFTSSPSVKRPMPAPLEAPPPEIAREQPAVAHKRASSPRLAEVHYRLQQRKLHLSELKQRTAERRSQLTRIQAELDQLSSPQDYLDNYEEIERLECLRAQLQRDQDADLAVVRSNQGYQSQTVTALKTLRGGFWTRLLSGSPCRSEAPQPGSPW